MALSPVIIRIAGLERRISPKTREALLVRAASLAIGIIRRRTRQGAMFEGRAFAPYSARYAEARRAAGRGTSVDLTLSGHMLGSLSVLRRSSRVAVIGFRGTAPIARIVARGRPTEGRSGAAVGKAVELGPGTVANAAKAEWAHFGTKRAPPRPFFGLSELDHRRIIADVARVLRLAK